MRNIGKLAVFALVVLLLLCVGVSTDVMADENEDIVIVIDPGHGGSQNGADYNGRLEKDITLKVSRLMAEELRKYDGVKVYLTRTKDQTMSIQKRAEYADKVGADYFFCIHFNASGNHNFYGAEAWVTSYGRYYSEMYAFAEIVLSEFEKIGVYNRGIKTKLDSDGTDYYGVLRRGAEFDIPAVIIEHCHMDNPVDEKFLDDEDDYIRFAKIDAECVAKFLRLSSKELGVDYSDYEYELVDEPEEKIKNDETPPELKVYVETFDEQNGKVTFGIEAYDNEYPILYYGLSYDGGETFETLQTWTSGNDAFLLTMDYEELENKKFSVIVYNAYNVFKTSGVIDWKGEIDKIKEQKAIEESIEMADREKYADVAPVIMEPQSGGEIYLVIAIVSLLAVISIVIYCVFDYKNKRDDEI